jgi:hypothetical protein
VVPSVVARDRLASDFAVDVSGVPNESICALGSERRACVRGFRDAFGTGVIELLRRYMRHDALDPEYVASFRLLEFSSVTAALHEGEPIALFLAVRWEFELRNRSGRPVLRLASRTEAPDLVLLGRPLENGLRSLLDRVLHSIGREFNQVLDAHARTLDAPAVRPTSSPAVL